VSPVVKAFLIYTAARLLVLFAVAGLLYLLGLRGFLLAMVALLVSLPVSYLLLRRQREAFGADVERRLAARRARRTELRAKLRGDDEPAR
jgi:predicted permease